MEKFTMLISIAVLLCFPYTCCQSDREQTEELITRILDALERHDENEPVMKNQDDDLKIAKLLQLMFELMRSKMPLDENSQETSEQEAYSEDEETSGPVSESSVGRDLSGSVSESSVGRDLSGSVSESSAGRDTSEQVERSDSNVSNDSVKRLLVALVKKTKHCGPKRKGEICSDSHDCCCGYTCWHWTCQVKTKPLKSGWWHDIFNREALEGRSNE